MAHHFNHALHIVVPDTDSLPPALADVTPHSDVYYTASIGPDRLLDASLRALFAAGKVCGVTVGAHVDGECVAAVLPTGTLVLSLDRATYHAFGLQGRSSSRDAVQRFVVKIGLADADFVPGEKRYERVRWCLTDRLGLEFAFLFTWTPSGGTGGIECPALAALPGAKRQSLNTESRVHHSVAVPRLEHALVDSSLSDDERVALSEWLGSVACGIIPDGSAECYHSSMGCPEPSRTSASIASCVWRGMITSSRIAAVLAAADAVVADGAVPWVALTVLGFQDTPISWGSAEHGFVEGGENHYTYVVGPGGHYLRFTSVDPGDGCP